MTNSNNLQEQRRLVPVKVYYLSDSFLMQDDAGKEVTVKASPEKFRDLLMKLKAKDEYSQPKSFRDKTYMEIVDGIMNNSDNGIYIWSTYWDKVDVGYLIIE